MKEIKKQTDTNRKRLIHLKDISYAYPGGMLVLNHMDLEFFRGDRLGLVAPNGSGKTTVFHIIMGLLKPLSGYIELFGSEKKEEKDFVDVRKRIGLLFQDSDDQLFCPTVLEDVAFGPLNLGKSREEALDISKKTLEFLGISEFENRITFKLSGGEKRLVALATILSMEPEILLLDEPTTGLDEKTRAILTKIIQETDISYMLISHNADFLYECTDNIFTIKDGRVINQGKMYRHSHDHIHTPSFLPDHGHGH
ncbi:energy-coupling factor ABC transporter ATP-binding protein [Desulfobacterales bacterium HSG16]|nr:energy-coupling factor ABC transporter ATP-binding protein [Desulfobacterales bacterium HSG16]